MTKSNCHCFLRKMLVFLKKKKRLIWQFLKKYFDSETKICFLGDQKKQQFLCLVISIQYLSDPMERSLVKDFSQTMWRSQNI